MFRRLPCLALLVACLANPALADPCGMVPPIYTGPGQPITRVGDQMTYVFYKDGIETFVIRPGFHGKVEEFGMLIPFPKPPALRKVPDNVFTQIRNAVDPPEVVINLFPDPVADFDNAFAQVQQNAEFADNLQVLREEEVRVIKKEAVGMYEVVVLAAGSAKALKRWMDEHEFKYPEGMDKPCNEYVEAGWCFVAVKTKVGEKSGADPRPGQRQAVARLPQGSAFDGAVQGMGFRFPTDQLVVPMRLSAFNAGELHNIVYLLTDAPQKIRSIPEEYVVRQVSGEQLHRNLTGPLPLRLLGGTEADLTEWHLKNLKSQRDPTPHNGVAKEIFAGDLLAVSSGKLSLPHEEKEKELLAIGERIGLRGPQIDELNQQGLTELRKQTVAQGLDDLKQMSLTVIDGDFPREVLGKNNLQFAEYRMPGRRNKTAVYDAKTKSPATVQGGVLILGEVRAAAQKRNAAPEVDERDPFDDSDPFGFNWRRLGALSLLAMAFGTLLLRRRLK